MRDFYKLFNFKICLFFLVFLKGTSVFAATYYLSNLQGDDSRSAQQAQNMATPWKSLAKLSAMSGQLQGGDQVLFKKGEVFTGSLIINASGTAGNPIVFGSYGDGALPELTGFVTINNWQSVGSNVYEAAVTGGLSYLNSVVINGAAKAVGRYPNVTAANQGYLTYDSYNGNSSITDSKLAGQTWAGGQIIMRKTRWIIDRADITSQGGTTINYTSPTGYTGAKGYGYFIQNHPSTLDSEGEWYYNTSAKTMRIYTASDPNKSQVRASIIETLVKIAGQSNLSFTGLRFTGAMSAAMQISAAQNIKISNCELLFSGKNAVDATGTTGLTITGTLINYTANNAISINGGSSSTLSNNQLKNTGTVAGMGDNGDGTYEGIAISGDNNLISGNVIDSTGYIPLSFSGNNVTVKNNVVSNFTLTKDDGGGIYTWNNSSNPPQNTGRIVSGNIVINGIGAPAGTDNTSKAYSHGIYMDDNAGQVEISGNTVSNCATYGLYVHNAHDLVIKQNTLYNNAVTQLVMEHDNVAADKPIYNCTVTGNILVAKQASQLAAEYKTKDNDIANFGTFDQNYYYRPLDNDLVIGVLQQVNGTYTYRNLSVASWKLLYGKDANAVVSAHNVPAYTVSAVTGSNQYGNGTFDSNIGGLYAYASANNCSTSWSSGNLDGGALKISFSSATNSSNYGSVIIGIGGVTAGKTYRLKFSMLGTNTGQALTTYLRQSTGNYADLSARSALTISSSRVEKEFVFTATATESNASIVFDVPEQSAALYLDNIKLEQVTAAATNPDQYISFFYNTNSSAQTFKTGATSYDAAGNAYTSIKLDPYSSAVLVSDTATTNTPGTVTAANCTATGTILREEWDNVGGTNISDIPLQTKPTFTSQLTAFEGPKDAADNYGSRIRGYICAPQTGSYTFWLATDDAGELWLSTNDNPANKVRIAYVNGWTNYREFGKYSTQKSVAITLQAGQKYYVEALQKEGGGGDNLSVQWQLPDATLETPLAGSHLSPYVDTTAAKIVTSTITGSGSITREVWDNVGGTNIADIPLQKTANSTSQLTSFEGPKDAADNYGSRVRGYVFAPQTGSYTFWLATDDAGELWLSTDDNPANKVRIANVDGWTNYREFGKYSTQKSTTITLQAGQKYYIEALQKEGAGGDNLTVQWQLPDGSMETPIAGIHLSPYTVQAADQTITFAALSAKTMGDAPFNLSATASSGLAVSFNVTSGPATISGNTLTITAAGTVVVEASQAGNASFNAAKTVSQSFTVAPAGCTATGTILREEWRNVPGNNISDFSFQTTPTSTSQLTTFEGPSNIGDNYASRIRGYICAPQTGSYVFWIAGDDAAELYISTDDNPANKIRIANLLSWTNIREFTKFGSQQSAAISLVAGKKYYIEAIQKQGGGGDNLSVQWQLPGGTIESPLPGKYLSPYNSAQGSNLFLNTSALNSTAITSAENGLETVKTGLFIYPNPAVEQSTVEFAVPDAGQTSVVLYNTKGQLMSTLFDGATAANTKIKLTLNVAKMQNGVYLVHLTSGQNVFTKKLIVLK